MRSKVTSLVFCAAAAAAFLPVNRSSAGEWVDSRVTFVVADDNVLANSGETTKNSPTAQFSANRQNSLFFDNYETRLSGFESLSHLVLYKKLPTYFSNLTSEASLALQALLVTDTNTVLLSDSGSFLNLVYKYSELENDKWELTAFPVTSDRFRLGYSYRISWGGSSIFFKGRDSSSVEGPVPGIKFRLTKPWGYFFAGAKAALVQQDIKNPDNKDQTIKEMVTNYGGLAGAGFDITPNLRLEAGGGVFQRGTNPEPDVRGKAITSSGGSAQLSWHKGLEIGTSADFRLYRNDPNQLASAYFTEEQYDDNLSYAVAAEVTQIGQPLQDPERMQSTTWQSAMAADLNVKVKKGFTKFHADVSYADLSFVLFNVPSLVPFQAYTKALAIKNTYFVAAGLEHFFAGSHLTPGIKVGALFLPSVTTDNQTEVIRSSSGSDRSTLQPGDEARPVLSAKAHVKMGLSESMLALAELLYTFDENATRFVQDAEGLVTPAYDQSSIIGFNVVLQSKF